MGFLKPLTTVGLATALTGTVAVTAAHPAHAQGTVSATLIPKGAMSKLRSYSPQRLTLSPEKPATITKVPSGLTAPLYGVLTLGAKDAALSYAVILDEPDSGPARLFVDSNANGDLTDDAAAVWSSRPYKLQDKTFTQYSGSVVVTLPVSGGRIPVTLNLYRFDKSDTGRAALKNVVLYYHDYVRSGQIKLGEKTYPVLLSDATSNGDFSNKETTQLLIDRDSDGHFYGKGRTYSAAKPFNIGGTTYEITSITPDGSQFTVAPASVTVAEVLPDPVLTPGKPAIAFNVKTTDGNTLAFPTAYKGKLVLLDFWATWCGPCKAELPKLTAAYKQFHGQGFEVLGVSLDQENAATKLASFTKANDMPWPQVYDGKYWKAEIAQMYGINAIPAPILVDGDTGKIVATGNALRGDELAITLQKALANKK